MLPQRAENYDRLPPRYRGGSGSVLLLIIIASILAGVPQKIYHHLTVQDHKKIKEYLDVGKEYTYFLNGEYHEALQRLPNVRIDEIDHLLAKNASFQDEIIRLKPPRSFEQHHKHLVASTYQTNTYLYIAKQLIKNQNNRSIYNQLNNQSEKINQTHRDLYQELLKGLDKENIFYEILSDGTVVYYIRVDGELQKMQYDLEKR